MYKVFIDKREVFITNRTENHLEDSSCLVLNSFSSDTVDFILNLFDSQVGLRRVIIEVSNVEEVFTQFKSKFKQLPAAGGIVTNREGKVLFIYRLGKWDLPKGKLEDGETIEQAAVREVEEECAVSNLTIIKKLADTFHVYWMDEQPILKQTYWYEMATDFEGVLVPQVEEGIERVEWLTADEIKAKVYPNTYSSIKELLSVSGY